MIEILTSPPAMAIYGALFWALIEMFFPGLNPVVRAIVKAIADAPVNNQIVSIAAEERAKTKSTAKSFLERAFKNGFFTRLAARYLKSKLP